MADGPPPEEESPSEMDMRLKSDRTRIADRQSQVAMRLAQRERRRRQEDHAKGVETELVTTPILAQLRERFMSRPDATEEQFALFLPRVLTHLRTSDPALADRLRAELSFVSRTKDATNNRSR
jgi:hypothetical protein